MDGNAVGGLVAYTKKGSKASLIAASVSSILLFSAALLLGADQILLGSVLGLGELPRSPTWEGLRKAFDKF